MFGFFLRRARTTATTGEVGRWREFENSPVSAVPVMVFGDDIDHPATDETYSRSALLNLSSAIIFDTDSLHCAEERGDIEL